MLGKLKKIVLTSFLSLSMIVPTVTSVYAEEKIEYSYENSLSSLVKNSNIAEGQVNYTSPEEVIKNTYWVDLEKLTIKDNENKDYYGAIPKYLKKPNETALKDNNFVYTMKAIPSSGISQDKLGMMITGVGNGIDFYRLSYLRGFDENNIDENYTNPNDKITENDKVNPFKFKEKDVLSSEEVHDASKLITLADLKKTNSKDSKKIDEISLGEDIKLDFSINADWIRRFVNGSTLALTRMGFDSENHINKIHNNLKGKFDSELVFTLDIPDGVKAEKDKIKIEANAPKIDNVDIFDITSDIKEENKDNKKIKVLVISLRLKEGKRNTEILWKNMIEELNKLDLSNIKLFISGLKVSKNAKLNENITIKGTNAGFIDLLRSDYDKDGSPFENPSDNNGTRREYIYFAAVQDPEGLDNAAPKDKPNQISYTFKIKETPAPMPKPQPKPVDPDWDKYLINNEPKVETHPVKAVVPGNKEPQIHEKYIFGYPDDTIKPEGNMTRAEAVAVVARLQNLKLEDKTNEIYTDTAKDAWYNTVINAAYKAGLLEEKKGEAFRPDEKITRGELAQLISHIDKKNDKIAPFEDVKGHKYEKAINMAYGNERIKGYPDGTFKPDNSITRAEVATMLNKLYDRYPDEKFIDARQDLIHNFKDMSYKGHWAYYDLVEAYETHKFYRLSNNMEEWIDIIR